MGRLHLFELEDQSWFPDLIRDAGTAYLAFVARLANHGSALAPIVAEALRRGGEDQIIDLCSGGSGPLPSLVESLAAPEGPLRAVILTDLYPNLGAFERQASENERITAIHESVDATRMPRELRGLRTLFSAFHHFRPDQAKKILSSAVADRAPIAIFEVVARHPAALLGMFFVPLMTLFCVPFLRPFRWGWLPLTYLIPVIPLFIFWDGFVSCLRCYSQRELRELSDELAPNDFEWEAGSFVMPGAPFDGTYLIGTPPRR